LESHQAHVGRFYGMLKNLAEYKKDISHEKFTAISLQVSPDLPLGVSASICLRALVDE
jgi:hypothetical protein